MQTPVNGFVAWKPLLTIVMLILFSLFIFHQWSRLQFQSDYFNVSFGENLLRTSPPPKVAIELTEQQLTELTTAYKSGFDHPDPGNGDPCQRLQLLTYKKLSAWRKRFRKRGFTMDKIKTMLQNGRREPFVNPKNGVTFTKIYDPKGTWMIVDFVDCIIWQVAPYNFK